MIIDFLGNFLGQRISTKIGITVLVLVTCFVGWLIFKEYHSFMQMRFENLELEIFNK